MKTLNQKGLFDTKAENCERFIGYVRVSTSDQVDGQSLEAQAEMIEAFCRSRGAELIEICADRGVSGAKAIDQREGFAVANGKLDSGLACGIVVVSLDRLSRNALDAIAKIKKLAESGKRVVILDFPGTNGPIDTSDPIQNFTLHIVAAVSELVRGQIAQKTRKTLQSMKRSGKVYGPIPFGFDRDGDKLVQNADEQKAIRLMRKLRADGVSYGKICEALARKGFTPKRGDRFTSQTVKVILQRVESDANPA